VFYCASCGSLGTNDHGHPIGTPFQCPKNKEHFARVVKPPTGIFWLNMERTIATLQNFSPMQVFSGRGGRAGVYHLCRLVLLLLVVWLVHPSDSIIIHWFGLLVFVYFTYDILLLSTHATFVSRYPANALRSLTLNLSSFFQLGIAYAIVYKFLGHMFNRSLTTMDAIYFSVVTIATVGYGDIQVIGNAPYTSLIELLILSEIVLGLYMLVGLVAVVVGWANEMPIYRVSKPLNDLRGPSNVGDKTRQG
jgi:Ion channel